MTEVALVTGAAGALGGEVARVLRARGCGLVLADVERARDRLVERAAALGESSVVAGDLATAELWTEAMPRVERERGAPPTLAAFVAGGWAGGRPVYEETTDDAWTAMLRANLETFYRGLRAVLPSMVARKKGAIVVIGSRAAVAPETSAGSAAYAASKAAVVALAQTVAAEVRDHGVRVNAVLPSTMDTPANRAAMPKADPSRWVSLASAAGVVAFLLGDESRDISGAAVPVYGRA
jgi:NAD(P)-dependent dehydrogenase (short-subunit alcohol dehydrogenase family)